MGSQILNTNSPSMNRQFFHFQSLIRALERRRHDYLYFLTNIKPSFQYDFYDLVENVWYIQEALNHYTTVLPSPIHAQVVVALTQMITEANVLGKQIELNPLRLHRRSPKAESEENLEALRASNFHAWNDVLNRMKAEVKPWWDQELERRRVKRDEAIKIRQRQRQSKL
ncbi:MAG: hypothetical protein Q9170_004690 [Blastenia crenularia]